MDIEYNSKEGCFAIVYKNGQTNVYQDFIKSESLDNKEILNKKFLTLCKKQNYFPKKVQVVKAVIFVEE